MLTESLNYRSSPHTSDRRKNRRYKVKSGTFAGCSPNVGEIINISLGGIAFSYIDFGRSGSTSSNFILCGQDGCCLDNLSYTIISDKVCNDTSALSHIVTKQRRIQFDNLTDDQRDKLQNFIAINQENG